MSQALRILLVEDQEDDAFLVTRALRRLEEPIETRRVESESDLLRELEGFAPAVVLSDLSLPGFDGMRALKLAREHRPDVPFIFVSGTIDGETAVDLLKQGVTDYVLKNNLGRLVPSVRRALREAQLAREHRRAEANYRGIFEHAVLGIYQLSPDGRCLAVNPALARLFGYENPAEMLAATPHLTDRFADAGRGKEFLARMTARGEVRDFEAEMLRKDRSRIWVAQHARLVRPVPGEPAVCEGFVEDTTRQRELEAQIQRSQRLESIGTLAGGVAHDLNNVISPILMAASILQHRPDGPEHARMVSLIETSARRGAQIIKQVLAFGSGEEGERSTLQIGYLLKDVLKVVSDAFPNGIAFDSSAERNLLPVVGDAVQLRQVLLDLCTNARDAMPEGGRLQLRARNVTLDPTCAALPPDAAPGRYILLEVGDTGTGIAPEILDRIFDPFFTTKGIGKGTGLGLSAVRGIVRSHGGFVHVTSMQPGGTTFHVYLPATQARAVETRAAAPVKAPNGHGETVLLVDDEETIRLAVRTVLAMHNYQVLTATDGVNALGIFSQKGDDISLVLTDLMMPVMDGVALTRALRRLRPALPVIVSSGRSEKARVAELEAMGIRAILDKPYATDTLLRTLDLALHPPPAPR